VLRGCLGHVLELRAASNVGVSLLLRFREQLIPPVRPVLGGISRSPGVSVSALAPQQPAANQTPIFLTGKPLGLILILPLIQMIVKSRDPLPADVYFRGKEEGCFASLLPLSCLVRCEMLQPRSPK